MLFLFHFMESTSISNSNREINFHFTFFSRFFSQSRHFVFVPSFLWAFQIFRSAFSVNFLLFFKSKLVNAYFPGFFFFVSNTITLLFAFQLLAKHFCQLHKNKYRGDIWDAATSWAFIVPFFTIEKSHIRQKNNWGRHDGPTDRTSYRDAKSHPKKRD